ncbi:winged helix-turn-helix domain-containing protein [Escherichia albertii]|uniref:winged helix-turn-helix domain-containing protein n=1 Tax=Escherichia albertii TaxID=208962 RepID=UPI000DE56F77|nr:winged helix-turn-helix domain-containing protein [Escherichia albertii]EFB7456227.1 transcriptional regulator [Escherichia albertii]EFO4719882.1 transcriptional regulator [Escherichia albertii]MCZ8598594.1 winged helix-turn-helix domain-containing protein [Escherichia albertii]
MDVEDYFSYHFLEGITLTKDGILTKGKQQLYIPPKELGVLLVLLEAAGTVVLKDNIIEKVWRTVVVSDESLTRCIYSLRCIFSKFGYERCIETVYRKGYRFSAQVYKTKINSSESYNNSIAVFPFHSPDSSVDVLAINQELVQSIAEKEADGLYTYPLAATDYCIDEESINSFLARFNPDYYVTGRVEKKEGLNTLYIEIIDTKNNHLVACLHLKPDEFTTISPFIINVITSRKIIVSSKKESSRRKLNEKDKILLTALSAGKNSLYRFTTESIEKAINIFNEIKGNSDIQSLNIECCCLLAECYISLAFHGEYEFEDAIHKASECIDNVSKSHIFDGQMLGIMGLITGLSGNSIVSQLFFHQAQINTLDLATLYYYIALVQFYNGNIGDAQFFIENSLKLEPCRNKIVIIKKCLEMHQYQNENIRYIQSHTASETSHRSELIKSMRKLIARQKLINHNDQYLVS